MNTQEITLNKKLSDFYNEYMQSDKQGISLIKYCVNNCTQECSTVTPDEYVKPIFALSMLLSIRKFKYTKDWNPNWTDETKKYCIFTFNDTIFKDEVMYANKALSFPTEEMMNKFFDEWKELIERAKDLL